MNLPKQMGSIVTASLEAASKEVVIQSDFTQDYSVATTPFITSQLISGDRTNLFKVNTRSHGTNQNSKHKIGISDVKSPTDAAR